MMFPNLPMLASYLIRLDLPNPIFTIKPCYLHILQTFTDWMGAATAATAATSATGGCYMGMEDDGRVSGKRNSTHYLTIIMQLSMDNC